MVLNCQLENRFFIIAGKQNRATSILGRPADETDLATSFFFFAPIGKELTRRATRARPYVIDLL
jgi:hypothetical protein